MSTVHIGAPPQNGLHIGYAGWGNPQIVIDPRIPLDASLAALHPGTFDLVVSDGLLNRVHGDCSLSHAVTGLRMLMAPGATLDVSLLATAAIARDALSFLSAFNPKRCQMLEKLCFRAPDDSSGLMYQQTFMDFRRILPFFVGMSPQVVKDVDARGIPYCPEEVRLDGISDEKWRSADAANSKADCLDHDRPTCLCCRRASTKMDQDRRFFSRYCKNHYHAARWICGEKMTAAYTVRILFKGDGQ